MKPIRYSNGKDNLYILECKRGYWVATYYEGHTIVADSITYENDGRWFYQTGYEFDTLQEAKAHCESFGFKMVP